MASGPMLAMLGDLPGDDDWAFEVKWDGVRTIARIERAGRLRRLWLTTRNGNDVTSRYPELAPLAKALPAKVLPLELDGEIVAFDENGRPSFGALQGRMHLSDSTRAAALASSAPVHFAIFDVLELAGEDVTGLAWEDRRALLEKLPIEVEHASISAVYDDGDALLEQMIDRGMEGVMAKRRSSVYRRGARGRDWIKVKPKPRQEFVIGGWTEGTGHRSSSFGALLLGYFKEDGSDELTYVGNVGSGFDDRVLGEVVDALEPLASVESPFEEAAEIRNSHFVLPRLVAEIEYGEMTADGRLRHPVFKGLRDDKAADEVKFERKN